MAAIPLYRFTDIQGQEFARLMEHGERYAVSREHYEEMEFQPEFARLPTREVYDSGAPNHPPLD